ncbi:MAG: hypothetical protein AAFV19_23950 [Pseudomonadota bacterium]
MDRLREMVDATYDDPKQSGRTLRVISFRLKEMIAQSKRFLHVRMEQAEDVRGGTPSSGPTDWEAFGALRYYINNPRTYVRAWSQIGGLLLAGLPR